MSDERADHDLCRRVKDGDESAARELLHQFYPFVLRIVRAHLPRRTSEEDLTQMIFIKIFHRLDQFAGRMPLEHWISRVAVNTCLNQLKAERVRPEMRLSDFSPENAAAIERMAVSEVTSPARDDVEFAQVLLRRLLEHLQPADRFLITLLHLEERSVEEIRARTGWSRSAIKVRAFRARAKMKQILEKMEVEGLP